MQAKNVFLICWLMLVASACAENEKTFSGECRHVVDGDSLYLRGEKQQIRLWGVDAPERDEAGYLPAKQMLTNLALGKSLSCIQQDIDKYGRVVARCFLLSDGKNKPAGTSREINRQLITAGVAKEYCRFTKGFYGFCRAGNPQ